MFWCVMLCDLVDIAQSYLTMKSLRLRVQYRRPDPEDGVETWMSIYQTTRCHVLRRASSGYSPVSLRSPDFDPMPVPNGIRVVDLVALGPVFWLPPVIIIVSMIRSCILFVSVTLYSLSSR